MPMGGNNKVVCFALVVGPPEWSNDDKALEVFLFGSLERRTPCPFWASNDLPGGQRVTE